MCEFAEVQEAAAAEWSVDILNIIPPQAKAIEAETERVRRNDKLYDLSEISGMNYIKDLMGSLASKHPNILEYVRQDLVAESSDLAVKHIC